MTNFALILRSITVILTDMQIRIFVNIRALGALMILKRQNKLSEVLWCFISEWTQMVGVWHRAGWDEFSNIFLDFGLLQEHEGLVFPLHLLNTQVLRHAVVTQSLRSTKVQKVSFSAAPARLRVLSKPFTFGMFAQAKYHVCDHPQVASFNAVCACWSGGTEACSLSTWPCYWVLNMHLVDAQTTTLRLFKNVLGCTVASG